MINIYFGSLYKCIRYIYIEFFPRDSKCNPCTNPTDKFEIIKRIFRFEGFLASKAMAVQHSKIES